MNDFNLIPDDKTFEKLASEYAKVKAKTFSSDNCVRPFSTPISQAQKPAEFPEAIASVAAEIISLYQQSFSILRKLENDASNAFKPIYRSFLEERQTLLKDFGGLRLHSSRAATLEYTAPNGSLKKRLNAILSKTLAKYSEIYELLPECEIKNRVLLLRLSDQNLTLRIMLEGN
jgi:hypothetical protein